MEPISRRAALLGLASLALAGCSGTAQTPTPTPTPTPSRTPLPTPTPTPTPTPFIDTTPRWPLTGVPLADGEAEKANHVAVALKISDVKAAHPQRGLESADIVFVEANGVAYTRLCAVFHSNIPKWAGPIRSIRPVDVPLLAPMKPAFGNTAAANWVMNYIKSFSDYIDNLYYFKVKGTGSYEIVSGRGALEHSVFSHPATLAKQSKFTAPPPLYFGYPPPGGQPSALSGTDVASVSIPYGKGTAFAMKYKYDAEKGVFLRSEPWGKHKMENGKQIAADNVLILRCKWKMAKIYKGTGAKDPVYSMIDGAGDGWALHGGKYVPIQWAKGAADQLFTIT
ncbi:MAG: DUF3048 domain-containing protein, partial [Propionibacteriaceae bacterium]|nr:DUF3048 domain-containing protein [Propionibacteriaceae bacterium]